MKFIMLLVRIMIVVLLITSTIANLNGNNEHAMHLLLWAIFMMATLIHSEVSK